MRDGKRLTAKTNENIDPREWDNVVLSTEEGTFFHSSLWNEVLSEFGKKTGTLEPRHVSTYDREGEMIGILPCFLDGFRRLISLPYCDYGGPCIKKWVREALPMMLKKAMEVAKKEGLLFTLVSLPPKYLELARGGGFTETKKAVTFILPIKGITMDYLWDKIWTSRTRIRTNIRKARKIGVTVEDVQERSQIETYYRIYLETMRRRKATPYPLEFFFTIWDVLSPARTLKMLLAKYRDKYIAGEIFFCWRKKLHFWGNVSLSEYFSLKPNDLLDYSAIKWGVENGYSQVDFGLTPPNERSGLYRVKKKWGGTPVSLPTLQKRYYGNFISVSGIHLATRFLGNRFCQALMALKR